MGKWQFDLQGAPSAAPLAGPASTQGLESVLTLEPLCKPAPGNEAVQGWKLEVTGHRPWDLEGNIKQC